MDLRVCISPSSKKISLYFMNGKNNIMFKTNGAVVYFAIINKYKMQ